MRSCEFCGSEVPDNASFCGICGRTVRSSPQTVRGNGNSATPGQGIPGAGSNVRVPGSPARTTRKPYQFSSQPYQDQQQADVPTVTYSPRTSVSSPVQQVPYVAPPATVNPGAQRYPYAQPQPPLYVGNAKPPKGPKRRGKGCLISAVVVLLLLIILGAIAIPTGQKVLAFGSAISTQSPLSTQTGYMNTSDRVNILLMGYGGAGHGGAYLTDSMIVMSIIPSTHHTTLISVPRDLWVQYPPNSGNYTKINAIYSMASNGNTNAVAGGVAIAQKVQLVTGLQINYWMTINFTGFKKFIDSIGGVDVNVPDSFNACYPKNDDASINASWIKVQFNKGLQHMDGATAIAYARAREPLEVCGMGTSENQYELTDFGRSRRQQLIMQAALSKLKDWHTWPSLYSALDALKGTLYSNLSLADLASFALKMDLNGAHKLGLTNNNVLVDSSADGQYILAPRNNDWQAIINYVKQGLYN